MVEKHIIMRDSPVPRAYCIQFEFHHPVPITANVVSSIIIPCPGILDEADQWFSSDTLVSFTNKSECDYTTEILFKVSINVICIHLYTANIKCICDLNGKYSKQLLLPLADFGYRFKVFRLLVHKDFNIILISNLLSSAYERKIIPETRTAH